MSLRGLLDRRRDERIPKEDPMKPVVHGVPLSPFVAKVLILLEEKGVAYESRSLIPQPKTPELLAMNPLGKIPILEHDGFVLPDSSVICAYFERLHPEPSFLPREPRDLARALWYEEYSDTAVLEAVAPVVFERFVKVHILGDTPDEARALAAIEHSIPPVFDYLERELPSGRSTLLPELSIADLALGAQLQTASLAGIEPDPARWPRLSAYGRSLRARPSFQAVLAAGIPRAA
jgi:glutathione S-transferase